MRDTGEREMEGNLRPSDFRARYSARDGMPDATSPASSATLPPSHSSCLADLERKNRRCRELPADTFPSSQRSDLGEQAGLAAESSWEKTDQGGGTRLE